MVYIFMTEFRSSGTKFYYHNDNSLEEKVISISSGISRFLSKIDYSRKIELFVFLKDRFGNISDFLIVHTIYSANLPSKLPFDMAVSEVTKLLNQI